MMPFRSRRAHLLYAAAWLPYGVSYFVVFLAQHWPKPIAFAHAVLNVLPAALLGVAVIAISQRLACNPKRKWPFIGWHLLAATTYSLAWWGAVIVLLTLLNTVLAHNWVFPPWGIFAGQWQIFSGLMIYANIAGFTYLVKALAAAAAEKNRRLEAEALRTQSDLNALRSQLNPHFLFNTLNSVIALVAGDPEKAAAALLTLSEMLRYALATHGSALQDEVTLREELRFIDGYLSLEALRLGDRLRIERSIDPSTLDLELPALTLQPLVENAIRHGIAPRPGHGTLRIESRRQAGEVTLQISDDGAGVSSPLAVVEAKGMGLRVVRRRLELRFGERATCTVQSEPGSGFCVAVRLPHEGARGCAVA